MQKSRNTRGKGGSFRQAESRSASGKPPARGQDRPAGGKPKHFGHADKPGTNPGKGRAEGPRTPYGGGKPARPAYAGKRQAAEPRGAADNDRPQPFKAKKPFGKKPFDKRPRPDRPEQRPEPAAPIKPKTTALPARQSYGQLLHGLHAVREAWLNPKRRCHQLWLTPAAETAFAPTLAAAIAAELDRPAPLRADRDMLDAMLPGALHQGIALDAAPLPELSLADLLAKQPRLLVLLDQVTDPHNVGAILRSAAAFGADGVILTERHAPGLTGTLAKSASGALEHVPLVAVVNLARALSELRDAGFWCVGLAEEGEKALGEHDLSGATALVLGAEGEGLRRLTRERCDALALLPTQGAISSLNVSNAAAIALYEAKRQKKSEQ